MDSRSVALVGFLALIAIARLYAEPASGSFVTRLSAPGKLEIVTHPAAVNFARNSGRGAISALPSYRPEPMQMRQVDVRSCDLSRLDLTGRLSDLLQADFDTRTVWPSSLPSGFDPAAIMELGQKPGLGLDAVHRRGITGAGVGIGIVDQSLLVDHVEYRVRLRLYEEIHWIPGAPAEIHGPAVAAMAVGKSVGVAPGADPDSIESYEPVVFWPLMKAQYTTALLVPMDSRCTAAFNGNSDYAFYRMGGLSWIEPWIAGLYALACQVDPTVTPDLFRGLARSTSVPARATIDGALTEYGHIVDPTALLEALR